MTVQGSDNFADALEVSVGANGPTPSGALTTEPGEPFPRSGLDRSAWWRYTAATGDPVLFDLTGTTYPGSAFDADTTIAVYTGTTLGDLTQVAWDDDGADVGYLSRLLLTGVQAGTTYWIQVASYDTSDDLDYLLTVTRYSAGEWANDADTVDAYAGSATWLRQWQHAGYARGGSPAGLMVQAADAAWSGTPTQPHPGIPGSLYPAYSTPVESNSATARNEPDEWDMTAVYGDYAASHVWETLQARTDLLTPPEPSLSLLPPEVYADGAFVDPAVAGVEWGDPVGVSAMTLDVSLDAGGYYDDPARTWQVFTRVDTTGTELPAFRSVADLTADFVPVGTIDAGDLDAAPVTLTFDATTALAGTGFGTEDRVIFALVDSTSLAGDTASVDGSGDQDWSIAARPFNTFELRQVVRYSYRLLYVSVGTGFVARRRRGGIRQRQRGDGINMSTVSRAIQHNSVQGSLRNIGFY